MYVAKRQEAGATNYMDVMAKICSCNFRTSTILGGRSRKEAGSRCDELHGCNVCRKEAGHEFAPGNSCIHARACPASKASVLGIRGDKVGATSCKNLVYAHYV